MSFLTTVVILFDMCRMFFFLKTTSVHRLNETRVVGLQERRLMVSEYRHKEPAYPAFRRSKLYCRFGKNSEAGAPYHRTFSFPFSACCGPSNALFPSVPILFGIEDLLQHGVQHSVGRNLGDLHPSVGELLLDVGQSDPDLLELGVLDVAGLVGVVLVEHLLQL